MRGQHVQWCSWVSRCASVEVCDTFGSHWMIFATERRPSPSAPVPLDGRGLLQHTVGPQRSTVREGGSSTHLQAVIGQVGEVGAHTVGVIGLRRCPQGGLAVQVDGVGCGWAGKARRGAGGGGRWQWERCRQEAVQQRDQQQHIRARAGTQRPPR